MKSYILTIPVMAMTTVMALAQNYGTNATPVRSLTPPLVQANTNQPNPAAAPPEPTNAAQTTSLEKPAVVITAQGTVLNDEQKRLVSQKLQEIPGVIVITNRIHVVGQINEAAGAATTNRSKSQRTVPRRNSF